MLKRAILIGVALSVAVACGGSPTASGSPTPASPSAAASPTPSGSPVAADPCKLVTQQEASALAGASFGPGLEEATGAEKRCTYGAKTINVFTVIVVQAPDLATAQAAEAQGIAGLQQLAANGGVVAPVQGVGDAAQSLRASYTQGNVNLHLGAIYTLKGTTFLGLVDVLVGKDAPTTDALAAAANVALGRL